MAEATSCPKSTDPHTALLLITNCVYDYDLTEIKETVKTCAETCRLKAVITNCSMEYKKTLLAENHGCDVLHIVLWEGNIEKDFLKRLQGEGHQHVHIADRRDMLNNKIHNTANLVIYMHNGYLADDTDVLCLKMMETSKTRRKVVSLGHRLFHSRSCKSSVSRTYLTCPKCSETILTVVHGLADMRCVRTSSSKSTVLAIEAVPTVHIEKCTGISREGVDSFLVENNRHYAILRKCQMVEQKPVWE